LPAPNTSIDFSLLLVEKIDAKLGRKAKKSIQKTSRQ